MRALGKSHIAIACGTVTVTIPLRDDTRSKFLFVFKVANLVGCVRAQNFLRTRYQCLEKIASVLKLHDKCLCGSKLYEGLG